MKLISIIVPVYNEEVNLPALYQQLKQVLGQLLNYDHEIIFVDDGSVDNSLIMIEQLAKQDDKVKYLQFSRNFSKEIATTAGLQYAQGDAVVMIDADLQHPVELLTEFIRKWEEGHKVVVGVREKNQGEGYIKRTGSWLFYKIMEAIGETHMIPRGTDYRLLDRTVVNVFNRFTERERMTRGLLDWLGFPQAFVRFKACKRLDGEAGYSFVKLVRLASSSFVSHSLFPLRLAGYLGIIITVISGFMGLFMLIERFILDDMLNLKITGTAFLAVFNLFLIGIVLICLGLIALYIGNIHREVMNRPLFVVRKQSHHFDNQSCFSKKDDLG
ncbi:MAG: glycosyltransferase family 2 protein [bacterium]